MSASTSRRGHAGLGRGRGLRQIAVLAVPLVLIAAYADLWGSGSLQVQVTTLLISVVMVVGLQIFSGTTGIMSFGHMAFVGTAAYAGGLLTLDPGTKSSLGLQLPGFLMEMELGLPAALLVAVVVVGVLAIITAVPLLRLSGTSAVIAIFAVLLIANVVFGAWTAVTHGVGGYYGVPEYTTIWIALLCALAAIAVALWFSGAPIGRKLKATREDEVAAASSGISVRSLRAQAWVLSAMVSGVGGVLLAHQLTAFSPSSFGLRPTFIIVAMLVVGGMLTVGGAVVGAILVTLVQQGLRPLEGHGVELGPLSLTRLTGLSDLALVVLILGALYFRPEGLLGRRELDEHLLTGWRRLRRPRGRPERPSDGAVKPE